MVWLAVSYIANCVVALKQFPKHEDSVDPTAIVEIEFQAQLFPEAYLNPEMDQFPGFKHVSKLMDKMETEKDNWLVYELGGPTLSSLLTNMTIGNR